MTDRLKISIGFVAVLATVAFGAFILATTALAEDAYSNTTTEAEKTRLEAAREAENKAMENAREAAKDADEDARELQKDFEELDRELGKELDEDRNDDFGWENADDEAVEHRSEVANFVHSLLKIASSTSRGIGDEVRKVAREQNDDRDKVAEAIDSVKGRNALVTLLIGADYKNLGELRSSIVAMENNIKQLENIKSKAPSVAGELDTEIKALAAEKERLAKIVEDNESKVSLFGWLVKLLQ